MRYKWVMGRDPGEEWREAIIYGVGRPLLLVFWAVVSWGTLFGGHLVLAALDKGISGAIQQALSGKDSLVLCTIDIGPMVWHHAACAPKSRCCSRFGIVRSSNDGYGRETAVQMRLAARG